MIDTACPYAKWMWIELIGFDNRKGDLGVDEFLDRAGFVPDAISLLLFNPDFVHLHEGMDQDIVLPIDVCSYYGHPFSEERQRQEWTTYQLRDLVRELRKRSIRVFFAVFDYFETKQWIGRHPEILNVLKSGETIASINPWKRLKGGAWYEDYFVEKLVQVLKDYAFDGYHGADGYAHPRVPVYEGDFSDDTVDQFTRATGLCLPEGITGNCDARPTQIRRRAEWIWAHARRAWIDFHVWRFGGFWQKVISAVHELGNQVVMNSVWTRDPFEAWYRYGVDYRKLADAGVDGFVVEAASAAVESLEVGDPSSRYLCNFMAMLLLNKAYTPQVPLLWLNGIKDTMEQWHALRHAPAALESEIIFMSNLYVRNSPGDWKRCVSGGVVCLADALKADEWKWLRNKWDIGFSTQMEGALGATLIWSDALHERQKEDFLTTRRWPVHRMVHRLIARGAPILSVANVRDLANVTGTILVINAHLLPRGELQEVCAYRNGPMILIADEEVSAMPPAFHFRDCVPRPLHCWGYNCISMPGANGVMPPDGASESASEDVLDYSDPPSWVQELASRPVSDRFVRECADVVTQCADAPRVIKGSAAVRVSAVRTSSNTLRLFVRNDGFNYLVSEIDVRRAIREVVPRNFFSGSPINPTGTAFSIRVPGRGVVVLDVEVSVP